MEDIFGITIIIILIIILILMIYNWSSVKKNFPNCGQNCGGSCGYKPPSKCDSCNTCNKPQTCVKQNVCNSCSNKS